MSQTLQVVKPKSEPERQTRTTVDTIAITPAIIKAWKLPGGQRPLKENKKVLALAEQLKVDGGVIPGIISIGILNGIWYLIDGQHRLHSFKLSGLQEGYCDVRFLHATSMRDINEEFVELNSHLVTMKPDDFLRGMEDSLPNLKKIRTACPFVGYGNIRTQVSKNGNVNTISMSSILRTWRMSAAEVPGGGGLGSVVGIAESLVEQEAASLVKFLQVARAAFGCDPEYFRLWGNLNMTICAWLYRRLVLTQYSPKTPRLEDDDFQKCLTALSADHTYLDFLSSRLMSERDRSPALNRVKAVFTKRLEELYRRKVQLPAPDWAPVSATTGKWRGKVS